MPGNFSSSTFPDDIPEDFPSNVITTAVKIRLRLDESKNATRMVAVATVQGKLVIFCRRKLVKDYSLPYEKCTSLLVYQPQSRKDFMIVCSASHQAAVIDLRSSEVAKEWTNVKEIVIKDERLLGFPQVNIFFHGSKVPKVVTHKSDWEDDQATNSPSSPQPRNMALKDVVQALEAQMKNAQNHLLAKEKQISLRQSMVNRSLTALVDSVTHQNPTRRAPTFSLALNQNQNALGKTAQDLDRAHLVKTSDVWKLVLDDVWIVGVTLTNISPQSLRDVQCLFTMSRQDANYKVHYYRFGLSDLTLDPSVNGLSTLLETDKTFDGTLASQESLTVIVITSLPEFIDAEVETANVFLSCSISDMIHHPASSFQLNLGSIRLAFKDLSSSTSDFDPSATDVMTLRRNMLGLLTALQTEEIVTVSTLSYASDTFSNSSKSLELKHFASLQCYYGNGSHGHVCLLVREKKRDQLMIQIRAESTKKMRWFIRKLQDTLADGCQLELRQSIDQVGICPFRHLSSAVNLLSDAEQVIATPEDEPMVIEDAEQSAETPLDKVRNAFKEKQAKALALSHGKPGNLRIPTEKYLGFQRDYYSNSWIKN